MSDSPITIKMSKQDWNEMTEALVPSIPMEDHELYGQTFLVKSYKHYEGIIISYIGLGAWQPVNFTIE
jgi:hypothetical protein